MFAEIFVSVFVAGILFAVIVFLILGIISGGSSLPLGAVVYGILPLGTAGFLLALDILCPSPEQQDKRLGRKTVQTADKMTEGKAAQKSHQYPEKTSEELSSEEQTIRKNS